MTDNPQQAAIKEDNPIIGRINRAETEAKGILESSEREAAGIIRQAKMKAQQIADEPMDISSFGRSEWLDSVKSQIEAINSENERTVASIRDTAGRKKGEVADFIISSVMKEED